MPAHCNCEECHSNINLCAWIASHPFPSYGEMCARIDKKFDFTRSMSLSAEYGEFNHIALKKIYDSKLNEEVSKKVGFEIYARGGLQALNANCDIFIHCTTLADAPPVVAHQATVLEYYWNGIM